jgi:hypothetical protein
MRGTTTLWLTALTAAITVPATAQQPGRWQRRSPGVAPPLTMFHSTHSFHLPTAEVLRTGEFEVVIAHRFTTPVSDGLPNLFGFDGPTNIRLSLAYAPSDRLMVILGRTNWQDNTDLALKFKALGLRSHALPLSVALAAGAAWNTEMPLRAFDDRRNFQFYGQVIANTMFGQRLALGIVPSYLRNPAPEADVTADAVTVGAYADLYLSPLWAVLVEWNVSAPQPGFPAYDHDAFSVGVHLETGGHFFKILLTNTPYTNLSQYLAGSPYAAGPGEWRLGFNITRLLGSKKETVAGG